jgi:gliding motility-associated-like protein
MYFCSMSTLKYLKTSATFFFGFTAAFFTNAQQMQICLGDDISVCAGQTVQIENCTPGSGQAGAIQLDNPEVIPQLWDDQWSGVRNIGFTFNFYGNNHTQFIIGSNGLISFNIAQAGGGCPWALGGVAPLPNAGFPSAHNSIMAAYADINPSAPGNVGNIQHQTIGTAPNRMCVILFRELGAFSCNQNVCHHMAIILYETTNVVEIHLGSKPICGNWNGGLAIQGIQGPGGTSATITPGRNVSQWTAFNDGRQFVPTDPNNTLAYTQSEIPFVLVNGTGSNTIWANTANATTWTYNNGILNINNPSSGTVGYFLAGSSCGLSVGSLSDTTWVTMSEINGVTSTTPDFCSAGVGTASINNVTGSNPPFSYSWAPSGQNTQTASNLNTGTHSVVITDAIGCNMTYDVDVLNNQPVASSSFTFESCIGSANGTATAQMIPEIGTLSYQWDDPLQQTTQTAVGLTAGTYNCIITSSENCTVTATVTVQVDNPMEPSIINQTDVTCHASNNGTATVGIVNGSEPFNFVWSGSNSTSSMANDLFVGDHTVFITDANGCSAQLSFSLSEPPALELTGISIPQEICVGATANLSAQGIGGSTPYTFTWYSNGVQVTQGQNVVVTPNAYFTEYCVVLSEQCGSPTDTLCTVVTWPADIIPSFTSDTTRGCNPTTINFQNTTESNLIANIFFEFGDGSSVNVGPTQPFTHTYTYAGSFTPQMTITTINGCVYSASFPNYIEISDYPSANFSWYPSQPVMFNPVANMVDMSSADVTQWLWNFQAGEPGTSSQQNPTVTFPFGDVADYLVTLIVTNDFGCMDSSSLVVPVISDVLIFAPNTFTPDGDKFNQTWQVYMQGIDIYQFNLLIFNRWGEIVWESNNIDIPWDGTYNGQLVPDGTYVWKIRTKNPYDDNVYEFQGFVNVLR